MTETSPGHGLLQHPLWPFIRQFIVTEKHRLEVKGVEKVDQPRTKSGKARRERLPDGLVDILLQIQVECARCHAVINPIRPRQPPGNRRSKVVGHGLHVSVACPNGVNGGGCSRGNEATAEVERIRLAVRD